MNYTVTDRTEPAITYAKAKSHLRLNDDAQEDYVTDLIEDAADYVEAETESTIGTRTITATFYEGDALDLPRGPVQTIATVTDANNSAVSYELRVVGNRETLCLTSSAVYPLTVTYTAGHNPPPLRRVMLDHIADRFENRTGTADKPAPYIERTLRSFTRTASVN